ncbi:MAG: hypothetical protein V3R85_12645 [Alphaproteobacteria bacterium]
MCLMGMVAVGKLVTVMQSFELQVYKASKWEFDSYFDDRDTALFEATRLHESDRYNGIRVLEEVFREGSDTSDCSVIYSRLKKMTEEVDPRLQAAKEVTRMVARESNKSTREQKGGASKSQKNKSRKKTKAGSTRKSGGSSGSKSHRSLYTLMIMATIILVIGVGAMVGLRYMAKFM